MITFKMQKRHYDIIEKISNDNEITIEEIISFFCDYIYDNDIHKTFEKAFVTETDEEVEVKTYTDYIDEWSEEVETKTSIIFEYMMEEIDGFKTEYELI